jgi:pimeloyl-ACP methyl ester carboxylesterase
VTGRRAATITLGLTIILAAIAFTQLPVIGAGGLLHPARRTAIGPTPDGCADERVQGEGVELAAWRCAGAGNRRGTLVYLHGIADNRSSAAGAIMRFTARGFDVVAYDSRAHGESGGDTCTYGFFEKADLARVLTTVPSGPVVLLGTSLGGAVALQHAAENPSVTAVIAAETFSDLRTVARERAPFFFSEAIIARAFTVAEQRANFAIDAVSPRAAASRIQAPVLLIHGEIDHETPPDHSRRIYAALAGPRELVIVPGAGHNQSLTNEVWSSIERWLEVHVPR